MIHDAGAPVSGCLRVDEHTAMCGAPASESFQILINLGDGDDVAHTTSASVDGGTGDDALTGEQGELMGGPGSDVLTATGFGAWFVDGDGKHPAPDRYLGARGKINSIDYTGRTEDLRIDLRSPFTTADGDYLENVSSAIGGLGDDVLIGNDGPNELYGGPGADRLLGLGGDDKLFTGIGSGAIVYSDPLGRDVVEGGAGNDQHPRRLPPQRGQPLSLRRRPRLHRPDPAARLRRRRLREARGGPDDRDRGSDPRAVERVPDRSGQRRLHRPRGRRRSWRAASTA